MKKQYMLVLLLVLGMPGAEYALPKAASAEIIKTKVVGDGVPFGRQRRVVIDSLKKIAGLVPIRDCYHIDSLLGALNASDEEVILVARSVVDAGLKQAYEILCREGDALAQQERNFLSQVVRELFVTMDAGRELFALARQNGSHTRSVRVSECMTPSPVASTRQGFVDELAIDRSLKVPAMSTLRLAVEESARVNGALVATEGRLYAPVVDRAPDSDLANGRLSVIGDALYLYDEQRSKWMSVMRPMVWFDFTQRAQDALDAAGETMGFRVPRAATITGVVAQSQPMVDKRTTWRIGREADFASIDAALASDRVCDGDRLLLLPGVITVSEPIIIKKGVAIEGAVAGQCTVQTEGKTTDPSAVFVLAASGSSLRNVTIRQRKVISTAAECAVSIQGVHDVCLDGLAIETMCCGVMVRGADWTIKNCHFMAVGPTYANYRFIVTYGNVGMSYVTGNMFAPSKGSGRSVFCAMTTARGDTFSGTLDISHNKQQGGNLRHFVLQESFEGEDRAFRLSIQNNVYADGNGGIVLYLTRHNALDLFSAITVAHNVVTNKSGKGLVAIDGIDASLDAGATEWAMFDNELINAAITAEDYADATGTAAYVGYNTRVFPALAVMYCDDVPRSASEPATYTVCVKNKTVAGTIATLPVYGQGGQSMHMNVDVAAGDVVYIGFDGCPNSPIVGLEYAYRPE